MATVEVPLTLHGERQSRAEVPECTVTESDMRRALALLAELAGDPSISQRDPLDPWSFNRKPEEAKALIKNMYVLFLLYTLLALACFPLPAR